MSVPAMQPLHNRPTETLPENEAGVKGVLTGSRSPRRTPTPAPRPHPLASKKRVLKHALRQRVTPQESIRSS